MKYTLTLFWFWGLALTAFVCFQKTQFQASHPTEALSQGLNSLNSSGKSTQNWAIRNKFAD